MEWPTSSLERLKRQHVGLDHEQIVFQGGGLGNVPLPDRPPEPETALANILCKDNIGYIV
jgi:hypothetical protein